MYMYYLLGYKLMELPISDARKEVIAENTYLLALDGDVDFQADAALRLVDLMKKNKGVGAACGRIHPTGTSYMAWYIHPQRDQKMRKCVWSRSRPVIGQAINTSQSQASCWTKHTLTHFPIAL